MKGLEDGDLVPTPGQLASRGQAGRTGADDGHPSPGVRVDVGVQLVEMVLGPVSHETFQGADGYRFALLAADAESFALGLLGADAPGHAGEGVVTEQGFRGAVQVAASEQLDEVGDVDPHRTTVDATWVLAVEAAFGLFHGQRLRIAEVDFLEVHRADDRGTRGHVVSLDLHPLLGGKVGTLRHRGVSPPAASAKPSIRQRLPSKAVFSVSRYIASRSASCLKSTWWASNSGPSTQA